MAVIASSNHCNVNAVSAQRCLQILQIQSGTTCGFDEDSPMDALRRVGNVAALSLAAMTFARASALTIMPLGDSLTEGLCTDGSNSNTPSSTCYVPYYEPVNSNIFNHYDTEPAFCGDFARRMVEDYNHGSTGGYRGPLLTRLQGAGISVTYQGSVRSGTALASPPLPVANAYHEGHGNWITEQLAYCTMGYPAHASVPAFGGYLAQQHPDVVLMLVGSNNVLNGALASQVADGILDLARRIESTAPKPRLLIASMPTRYDFSTSPVRPNAAFESTRKDVSRLVALGSGKDHPCTARDLTDMSVLTSDDFTPAAAAGGLHLNVQGYAKMAEIWASAITAPECRFDSRTFITLGGVLIESISAYGRYWNFDFHTGALMQNGPLNTSDIPRYQSICNGHAVCTFDTRTFIGDGESATESITAFNSYYDFSVAGALLSSGTLRSVNGYNQFVCAYSNDPAACVFDTRAMQDRSGTQVETITAYGRYVDFNAATHTYIGSGPLSGVSRYARICALKPASEPYCTFDTRSFVRAQANGPYLESITAYGRYWDFDADSGELIDAGLLSDNLKYDPAADIVFANGFD